MAGYSSIPCAVCSETDPSAFRIWFDGYIKLYKCRSCGFVAQFPGPGRFTIVTDYQDFYTMDFLDKGRQFMDPQRSVVFEDIVDRITKIKPRGTLLDVGCGDGHFLSIAAKRGLSCHGVEDCVPMARYTAAKTGAHIVEGQYCREMFPAEQFDIITMIQVVEHIPAPAEALKAAKHHLKPDGILVVEVPSLHSPHFLAYRWTGIKTFVKPPDGVIRCHVGYYTPDTLRLLAKTCGFTTVSLVTGRWQYKYSGLLKQIGRVIDPLLATLEIGGVLFIGTRSE